MDANANRQVGSVLRSLRKKAGLTQVHVARELGVPQSHVSKIESGDRSLHVAELFAYAAALKLDEHYLLDQIKQTLLG